MILPIQCFDPRQVLAYPLPYLSGPGCYFYFHTPVSFYIIEQLITFYSSSFFAFSQRISTDRQCPIPSIFLFLIVSYIFLFSLTFSSTSLFLTLSGHLIFSNLLHTTNMGNPPLILLHPIFLKPRFQLHIMQYFT